MSVAYRETPLLEVRNVFKSYPVPGGFWKKKRQPILRGVNLTLSEGSSVGLIGESGEGKSTLGRLILGLEQPDSGQIILEGLPVKVWSKEHPGQMSVVFQDYTSSANPRFTVEELIREPLDILRLLPPVRAGTDSLRTKRKPAASAPPACAGTDSFRAASPPVENL